jgi:glycosyltransferase
VLRHANEFPAAMKISTVTVCRNSQATIARAVESFLRQNHPDKELLVIDGGSTDSTVEIVRRFGNDSIRVISEMDRGIYDAMNKGLANFTGAAVGFLNSDDVYHDEHALARIAQALESADAVYGNLVMVTDHATGAVVREWNSGEFTPGAFREGWMPPHPTFYVRRELAARTGIFDLSYRISADYDFMLRALELQRARVAHIPHVLVDFLVGGMSTTGPGAVIRGNLECLRARRRHLGAPWLDAALFMKPLQKLRQLRGARPGRTV